MPRCPIMLRPRGLLLLLSLVAALTAATALSSVPSAHAADASEGIDVAQYQDGVDFAAAKQSGVTFSIAKAGGSQLAAGPYVTRTYAAQVDGARTAGLRVGHYWLSGDYQTPAAAADYFVDHLHDYRAGDVLALDDEVIDDSHTLWTDDAVSAFFTELKSRVSNPVLWFYISASPLRAHSWTRTIATGAKLWVASYGPNDGSYHGEPDIGSAYPCYFVHQYTSAGRIGSVGVDRDRALSGAFDPSVPCSGAPAKLPKTTTEQDGVPGPVFWKRCQHWLALSDGYTGPIDGEPGVNTYKALQRDLAAHWGYTGPIDGDPGPETYKAWQRLAAAHGYTGPIDGALGPNSYRAIATFLNEDAWD